MILEIMQQRRSVRRFKADPLPENILSQLIEAAISAPSAGNKQPWRFRIVRDRKLIESAADSVENECTRIVSVIKTEFQSHTGHYLKHFSVFRHAPVLIIPLYRVFVGLSGMVNKEIFTEDIDVLKTLEHHNSLMSVSLAIQNILLMGQELGLGTCCMTGPLIAAKQLTECFQIPEGWQIGAVIAVGYPNEQPANPGRKPLSSVVRWL